MKNTVDLVALFFSIEFHGLYSSVGAVVCTFWYTTRPEFAQQSVKHHDLAVNGFSKTSRELSTWMIVYQVWKINMQLLNHLGQPPAFVSTNSLLVEDCSIPRASLWGKLGQSKMICTGFDQLISLLHVGKVRSFASYFHVDVAGRGSWRIIC